MRRSADDDRSARAGSGEADDGENQNERYKDEKDHPLRHLELPDLECAAHVQDSREKRPVWMRGNCRQEVRFGKWIEHWPIPPSVPGAGTQPPARILRRGATL